MMRALCLALILSAAPALAGPAEDAAAAWKAGDHAAAAAIWAPLAEGGDPVAQFNMGILHDQGQGVAADPAQAVAWYRRAAEAGDARAAFNLGQAHLTGTGAPKDVAEAIRWYAVAAEAGDVLAQYRLGILLSDGAE
ncbi:MAG TPA: sel1 repeat family protein, partial [Paracoccaceae bacterium]|nr:sel1 repeat family protein [Paracoccaceae bacterium]